MCIFLHVLWSKFDWGLVIGNKPGPLTVCFYCETWPGSSFLNRTPQDRKPQMPSPAGESLTWAHYFALQYTCVYNFCTRMNTVMLQILRQGNYDRGTFFLGRTEQSKLNMSRRVRTAKHEVALSIGFFPLSAFENLNWRVFNCYCGCTL